MCHGLLGVPLRILSHIAFICGSVFAEQIIKWSESVVSLNTSRTIKPSAFFSSAHSTIVLTRSDEGFSVAGWSGKSVFSRNK